MGVVEELLEGLNRVPGWKRISASPDRLDELTRRVEALENRLSGQGDICPRCKEMTFELKDTKPHPTFGQLGGLSHTYECAECGYSVERFDDGSQAAR